jgi:anti-sigma B factor antagonist
MPKAQVSSDSLLSPLPAAEPAFASASSDGGRGAAWVRVAGELDRATAPRLAQTLADATRRARIVVVDVRGLTRVDGSGVDAIVDASSSARRDGRQLVLVSGPSQVERLLALAGASDAVEVVDLATREPSIRTLRQIASKGRPDPSKRARAPRRVATLLGFGEITRGVDASDRARVGRDLID